MNKLSLRDYRGFKSLDIDFAPDVTALVGVNGAGKTSILDAVALLSSCIQLSILRTGGLLGLVPSDVREGASSARVTVTAEIQDLSVEWSLATTLPGHPPGEPTDLSALGPPTDAAKHAIAAGSPVLPLVVYLSTNRAVLANPERSNRSRGFNALDAYEGALTAGATNFSGFFDWFREEEDLYNEQLALEASGETAGVQSALPAVRAAIEKLLPSARRVRIERKLRRMTVEIHGVRIDVAQLSNGEKYLLALAGDLARRMALAAPKATDPLALPAVVLIDEIETHLHPGLQREIIPRLRQVFPRTQLIVSTHSPMVLSSLHGANVRVLDRFELVPFERATWRRDTNRILEAAFGDPGHPPEVAGKMNALRNAVDEDRFEEARALLRELGAMIEGDDPELFFYAARPRPEAPPATAT